MNSSLTLPSSAPSAARRKARSGFPKKKTAGFTIFEVGLSGTVLVFGLCSAILTLQRGFQALDTARNNSVASQIMQNEIERLRLLSWSELTNTALVPVSGTVDLVHAFPDSPLVASRFSATRTVTPCVGREDSMVDILVQVSWTSQDGVNHSRQFKTRYSKNGLYDFYYTNHT